MRTWTYSYKTSDGFRHEGEISAPSKDDVYAELRRQGIRAIRVDERVVPIVRKGFRGLRKRDWLLIVAAVLAILGVAVAFAPKKVASPEPQPAPPVEKDPALENPDFVRLADSVEDAMSAFREAFAMIDRELLSNYRLVSRPDSDGEFAAEIAKGRAIIAKVRAAIKEAYDESYVNIPESCSAAREVAQRLYGEVMAEIDAASEGLDGDECAIDLLRGNRGKWTVERGEVKWSDPQLERTFGVVRRGSLSASSRWQGGGIVSRTIMVRPDGKAEYLSDDKLRR